MRLIALLSIFIFPAFSLSTLPPVPSHLNFTVIAAANGKSTLECWQLSAPFVQSSQAGTSGAAVTQLGDVGTASYTFIPPQFDGGLHNAPVVQWVIFLSGLAVVSLPNSTETLTIHGGDGLLLAADTKNVSTLGHRTVYPSKKETVAVQIPTRNNEIPAYSVLYSGPCKRREMDQ